MSDLEQQAASWVPPWQRASDSSTPDSAASELDDIDEEIPTDEPWCDSEDGPSDDGDSGSFASSLTEEDSSPQTPAEHAGADEAGHASTDGLDPAAEAELADAVVSVPEGGATAETTSGEAGALEGSAGAGLAAAAESAFAAALGSTDGGDAEAGEVAAEPGGEGGAAKEPGTSARNKAKAAKRMAAAKAALAAADEAAMVPGQRTSEEDSEPLPGLAPHEIVPALEAILMVVDEPVSEILLSQVLDIPAEDIAGTLIELSASYTRDGKGFDLRRAAGGWRFYTRADYSAYVERFVLDGQQLRLTQASLETLAVVAYKQPVTRSRISAIRGVNVDGVIRTLVTRGMVEECGNDPDSGAHLYRTTSLFLEKLGLDSVEQLPPLAPFLPDNLDEVEAL